MTNQNSKGESRSEEYTCSGPGEDKAEQTRSGYSRARDCRADQEMTDQARKDRADQKSICVVGLVRTKQSRPGEGTAGQETVEQTRR
jgi:hypothetical protein